MKVFGALLTLFCLSACVWCSPECPSVPSLEGPTPEKAIKVSVKKKFNEYTLGGNFSKIYTDFLIEELKKQDSLIYVEQTEDADFEIDLHAYGSYQPKERQFCNYVAILSVGLIPCWDNNTLFFNIDITDKKSGLTEGFTWQQDTVKMFHLFALMPRYLNPEVYSETAVQKRITTQLLKQIQDYVYDINKNEDGIIAGEQSVETLSSAAPIEAVIKE